MYIEVTNVYGKSLTYEVNPNDTILTLKRKLREKEKIPLLRMALIYHGKNLHYDRTFSDYYIHELSKIGMDYSTGGGYNCEGCVLPALIHLSANVSLQCGENLSFDDVQLLHSIQTQLTSLKHGITEAIINCIETCGSKWSDMEEDDANYYQDHAERRRSQAVQKFIAAIYFMLNPYIEKYRTSEMIKKMRNPVNYTNNSESILTKSVDIDWLKFLHETRCPICFCRFNNVQLETNTPNRFRTDDFT